MPLFDWTPVPREGGCLGCLASDCKMGFVDTNAKTPIREVDIEQAGIVRVIYCADCVLAMSKLVGAATPAETYAFAERELDLVNENEKLKDEIKSWRERFETTFDVKLAETEA